MNPLLPTYLNRTIPEYNDLSLEKLSLTKCSTLYVAKYLISSQFVQRSDAESIIGY